MGSGERIYPKFLIFVFHDMKRAQITLSLESNRREADMDIETLKDSLEEATFSELQEFVSDLKGQRDTARNESISGRKGLKEKVTSLESQQAALMERLGIDSIDDIDDLPDVKGAAEAGKQYEAKLKRMQRDMEAAQAQSQEASSKYMESQKRVKLGSALGSHEWVAKDIVEQFISPRLEWEGDELFYKDESGSLIAVNDGVAMLAKSRPELLKPTGAGGAGVRSANTRGAGDAKTMTRADFDSASQVQRAEFARSGGKVVEAA